MAKKKTTEKQGKKSVDGMPALIAVITALESLEGCFEKTRVLIAAAAYFDISLES